VRYIAGFILAPLFFVAVACASLESGGAIPSASAPSTLDLYAEAYAAGQHGFSCIPAAHVGGPARSDFLRLEKRLENRRRMVREQLVRKYGAAALDAIEQRFREELESVYLVEPCKFAPDQRTQFARLLRKLERRIASSTY
jgi:hypothetical protein